MSLILHPNSAPGQATVVAARAGAPRDEQAQPQSPRFDEVLVRTLGAGLETTEKPAAKPAAATPARRQSLAPKNDAAELANAIAMTLVGLDGSGSQTSAGERRLTGPADLPVGLSDGSPAPEALAQDGAALAGSTRRPGLRLASTTTASATVKAGSSATRLDPTASALADPAQTVPSAGPVAASAQPSLTPATSIPDRAARDDAGEANRRQPTGAANTAPLAALAASMLPLARPASAETVAPDAAAAQGAARRPGLRVEPAMTSSKAASAAATVAAKPAMTDLDSTVPMPAALPSLALQGASALPVGPQSPGQVTPPAAASDPLTLALGAAGSAAQLPLADAGQADRSLRNATESVDGPHPMPARDADSTTAATASLRTIDAHTGLAVSVAAGTPRDAMNVKAEPLSASPDKPVPGLGSTPAPVLKTGKMPVAGDSDDTSQPTPPALSAGASEQAAPPLAADSFASQALGPDPAAPAADALGAGAPALLHPLPAAAAGATGHAAASHSGELPYAPRLSPEVGSKEWNQALGQQVLQLGQAGQQVTELQLNPPGLGPMQVTLQLNQHQMQVMFVSAHASVRAAVEAAMPQLRASLADSGISLGQASVSSESQAQSAFAQQQQSAARQQAYRNHSLPEPAAVSARALAGVRRGGTGRGVDTYA